MLWVTVDSSGSSAEVSQAVIAGGEASLVVILAEKERVLKGSIIVPKRLRGGRAAMYDVNIARHRPPRARRTLFKNMLLFLPGWCPSVLTLKRFLKTPDQTYASLRSF